MRITWPIAQISVTSILVLISLAQHQAAATVKKTHKQLFFGDKILDLESDFLEIGLRSSVAVPH